MWVPRYFQLKRLRKELDALKAQDRVERQGVTTDDMMAAIVARAERMVTIRLQISELQGYPEDDDEDLWHDVFNTSIPSSMLCPTGEEKGNTQ